MSGCPFHSRHESGFSLSAFAKELNARALSPESPFHHEEFNHTAEPEERARLSSKIQINSASAETIAAIWKDVDAWISKHPASLGLSKREHGELIPLTHDEIEASLSGDRKLLHNLLTLKHLAVTTFDHFIRKDCGSEQFGDAPLAPVIADYAELLHVHLPFSSHRDPSLHIGGPFQGSQDVYFSTAFVALSHLVTDARNPACPNQSRAQQVITDPSQLSDFIQHTLSSLLTLTSLPVEMASELHTTLFEVPVWSYLPRTYIDYEHPTPRLSLQGDYVERTLHELETSLQQQRERATDLDLERLRGPRFDVTGCPAHELQPDQTRVTAKVRDWVRTVIMTFIAPRLYQCEL